jgi:serine/threonine protein kinase
MGESNGNEFHVRVIVRALEKKIISFQQTLTLIDAIQNTKVDSLGALFMAHDLLDTSEYAAHEASALRESLHSTVVDADEPAPPWSSKLSPRYQLHEKVGLGGTGSVYRAIDQALERTVAIKVLRRDGKGEHRINPNHFIREAICLASMDSKYVPVILDRGFDDGEPFLAMEYYPRTLQSEIVSLHSLHGAEQKKKLREAIGCLKKICDAVSHAHQRGMAHRDIKPSNILVSDSKAVLGDWGLASALLDHPEPSPVKNVEIATEGSPGQRSPEAFNSYQASRTVSHDVFALGATLYRILTNELPPEPFQIADTVDSKLNISVEPLISVCTKAMSPVGTRYSNAIALGEDLDAWMSGGLPKAHGSTTRKISHWSKANVWLLSAGIVAAAIAIGSYFFVTAAQEKVEATNKTVEASDETVEKLIEELLIEPEREFGQLTKTSGTYLNRKAQLESATRMAQELIDKRGSAEDRLRLVKVLQRRSGLESRIGNDKEALECLDESSKMIESLASEDRVNSKIQSMQASQYYQQASLYRQHGEFLKSIETMRKVVALRELLSTKGEVNQDQLAFAYLSLGYMELEQNQTGPAKKNLGVAIANLESRVESEPENANICRGLGEAYLKLSVCFAIETDLEKGKKAVEKSSKYFAILLQDFPEQAEVRQMHALTIYNHGQMEIDSGNTVLGVRKMEEAAEKLDEIILANPNGEGAKDILGRALRGIAKGYLELEDYKAADLAASRALAIHAGKESLLAMSQFYRASLAKGDAQRGMRDIKGACSSYQECLAGCKKMLEENPDFKIAQELQEKVLKTYLEVCREQSKSNAPFAETPKLLIWGTQACEVNSWTNSVLLSTLAATYELSGDFANAAKYQKMAIKHARSEELELMKTKLDHYRKLNSSTE